MAENNFVTHPARVKVVTTIDNVNYNQFKVGELIYDSGTNRLYIRIVSGWKYINTDG